MKFLKKEDLNKGGLDLIYADKMVENCIGKLSIPLGLGLNFVINGSPYKVPMAIEEPSVIAAASSAAKFVAARSVSGFESSSTLPVMTGQVQILDLKDVVKAKSIIIDAKSFLLGKKQEGQCPKI